MERTKKSEIPGIKVDKVHVYIMVNGDDDVSNIFTARQIDEFKKIYTFKPLQDSLKKEKKSSIKLEKQDDGFDAQEALKRYREIKAMTQSESNFCFLGMIDASVRFGMLNNGIQKMYLTTNYNYSGMSVCQAAWLTICGIGRSR
ncbi:37478_t:CDS:2 [Gigaspora margarita]|uniref:37478_t:CDS:1 n=1 Tax=Gigaspora margarita TaxID=4874 RepID=A0ABN7VM79_GIGMA|nr:37478_t:CDS:2 [Gigaspora margarita]